MMGEIRRMLKRLKIKAWWTPAGGQYQSETGGEYIDTITFTPGYSLLRMASERIKITLPFGFSAMIGLKGAFAIYRYGEKCEIFTTGLYGAAKLVWNENGLKQEQICSYKKCIG
jgi:hypothetical protein